MKGNRLIFIVLLFCFIVPAFQLSFGQDGDVVQRVKIKGNRAYYDGKLKQVFKLKGTDIFQRWVMRREKEIFYAETLAEDELNLKAFYQKAGYLNCKYDSVAVIPSKKKRKVKVIVYLNEGKPYDFGASSIIINGNQKLNSFFKGQALKTKVYNLQTKRGNRFEDVAVYADEAEISHWFADEGYPYTTVKKQIILKKDSLIANINWNVTTGPICRFGPVRVTGMDKISKSIILRNNTCKEGEIYSRAEAENTQKQLVDLGVYNVVTITPTLSENHSDTIPMLINVKEAPRFTSKFGVGYGTEQKLRGFVKLTKIGIFGGARRGEFYVSGNSLEPYNISLKFIQPAFIMPLTSLVLYPYAIKQNERGYELTKVGGSIIVQKASNKYLVNAISYNYENVNLDTTSVADISSNAALSSVYTKAGFAWATVYDNTNPKFDPHSGFVAVFNAKLNGTFIKQKYPFGKLSGEYKKYMVPYRKWVVASKILLGAMESIDKGTAIPVEELFFSGGSGSMRGWQRNELGPINAEMVPLGGKSVLESCVEVRVPIIDPFRAVFFVEAGNVWEKSFYLNFGDLRYDAGVGLRMSSPIGPIGFDVAIPIFDQSNTWQFMINIGPTF